MAAERGESSGFWRRGRARRWKIVGGAWTIDAGARGIGDLGATMAVGGLTMHAGRWIMTGGAFTMRVGLWKIGAGRISICVGVVAVREWGRMILDETLG